VTDIGSLFHFASGPPAQGAGSQTALNQTPPPLMAATK
jgi:hypothetical protein